jgi:hypothetical protein
MDYGHGCRWHYLQTFSQIPMNLVSHKAVLKTSIAISMHNGQQIIINFPPAVLNGLENLPFIAHIMEGDR